MSAESRVQAVRVDAASDAVAQGIRVGGSVEVSNTELLQQEHYDRISTEYEAHYGDPCSQQYRQQFIYQPMFQGMELKNKRVLDALCGGGQATDYLLQQGAHVTGLDISREAMDAFTRRWPECDAACTSILDSGFDSDSFDCVAVIGGLHHMHPHVSATVEEIHRILKPGGQFCFMEPHSGSFPDIIRKFWYKHDAYFSDNEASIDVPALRKEFDDRFEFRHVKYQGNIAFLLVLNSLIFRIPLRLKPIYTPTLMFLESLIGRLQGKVTSCFVVGQWVKK